MTVLTPVLLTYEIMRLRFASFPLTQTLCPYPQNAMSKYYVSYKKE